jgi:hypothetical protein
MRIRIRGQRAQRRPRRVSGTRARRREVRERDERFGSFCGSGGFVVRHGERGVAHGVEGFGGQPTDRVVFGAFGSNRLVCFEQILIKRRVSRGHRAPLHRFLAPQHVPYALLKPNGASAEMNSAVRENKKQVRSRGLRQNPVASRFRLVFATTRNRRLGER